MKLLVIGAGKGVGLALVEQALAAGHEVTALSRSAASLPIDHAGLRKVPGSFADPAVVNAAVAGQQAVAICPGLGIWALKRQPTFFSAGTAVVLGAMQQQQVKRAVVLSNLAAGDGERLLNPLERCFTNWFIREATDDHTQQEKLVQQASDWGLQWVIARPTRLTNGVARQRYLARVGERVPSAIARADVAHFLLEAATTDQWLNRIWNLGG